MNHTERMNEVARRHRYLTRRIAKDAVETYLELFAEDIAAGEWVELHGIGKLQTIIEAGTGTLFPKGMTQARYIKRRLRIKVRLANAFKQQCYGDK